jgi:hypothetical protein
LAAEGHLAVGADRFYVAGGHCAEGGFGLIVWFGGAAAGSHIGRCMGSVIGNERCGEVGKMLSNERRVLRLCDYAIADVRSW